MRILVTGSRDWPGDFESRSRIYDAIAEAAADTPGRDVTVVHGAARGADTFAHQAALMLGFTPEPHPADWGKHGKGGGPIRNQEMVDAGADVCLAFYILGVPCVGTTDCDRRAVAAGIPVTRVGAP